MPPHRGPIKLQQFARCILLFFGCLKRNRLIVVPAFLIVFASLKNEHRPWRKFAYTLKDSEWRGRIAEAQEQVEGNWIDLPCGGFGGENRPNFRSKTELAA